MNSTDLVGTSKVGDGSGNAEHPVIATRGEPHGNRGIGQQLSSALVRRCNLFKEITIGLGISPDTFVAITSGLNPPRSCDAVSNGVASF